MADTKKQENHVSGHRERLRARFRQAGGAGFHDYEMLELLLTYVIPRRDVKPIAKRLLARFGSLASVLDAAHENLEEVSGIGPRAAGLLRLQKALVTRYNEDDLEQKDVLSHASRVARFARAVLSDRRNEAFMVISVNTRHEVIGYEILHEGTVDETVVYPRRILEEALKKSAFAIILVHNHPSGHVVPSPADKNLTQAVLEAARTVRLPVLDHLIVGQKGWASLRDLGWMPKEASVKLPAKVAGEPSNNMY